MRVFIDTNVLISAALSPNGTPYKAFLKAVSHPNKGLICDQNIEEMRRIFNRKFPNKISLYEHFISIALLSIELVSIPEEPNIDENSIRDVADRPILRAAIYGKADVLLTGDKDFLESGLTNPKIVTPTEFLDIRI